MEIRSSYDVIVVGAGIAGISAAVKAGRSGARVLLVEQYGFVGGMSTAGMVSPFMKHAVQGEVLVRGVFEDIEREMRAQNGMIDNGFYAHAFRSASYHLLTEAGCTMLLHAVIAGVHRTDERVDSITVFVAGRTLTISASVFIDTSGDAQLLFLAGLPWAKGDEATGKLQALTLFFRMGNIDLQRVTDYAAANRKEFFDWMDTSFDLTKIVSVAGYFSIVKKAIAEGRLSPDVQYIFFTTLPGSGEGSFNTSNILALDGSTSPDLTRAELTGRKQVHQVVTLLKNEVPGFERSYLIETAPQVGVRETRRAVGDYAVTGEDIKRGRKFDDSIARGCYGIDIHGQKDEESRMEHLPEGDYYEIPLRALLVKEAVNVLVAGRCISSTREGHSALRIQPTSAATGEACGALAALAVRKDLPLRSVDVRSVQELIAHNITQR
ncbi:MAG: FAD-dependent oxidoreductase [Bacteroidetes bacterium]|nr:FAD-dependent oxidoreductase [Bacteroidota bacterium]